VTTNWVSASQARTDEEVSAPPAYLGQRATLLDLIDRVLDKGVVLSAQLMLSVADVDLIYIDFRAFLASVESARRTGTRSEPIAEVRA